MNTKNVSPGRAGRREWIGLAVIALPCLVYAMDLTVLNLALPALSSDLEPSSSQLLWIVDIYGFMVAGALITMGALGDRIGGRRLLMIGAGAFAAASILAAFSTSAPMLIAARALLGLAGATLAPSTLSLITTMFQDSKQRTAAIGVWVTSYSVGAAVGPLAGGALLDHFWWGSVFLLAVPVMVLLLVAAPRLLPDPRNEDAARLDLRSAALSVAAVLAFIYGLKQIAISGPAPLPILWIVAGISLAAAFISRQRRLTEPLIDLQLFRRPAFSAALGSNLVAFFVVFGMSLFVAQYLQSVLGLSPLEAGIWSVPEALGFIAGSMAAPRLIDRFSAPVLIGGGMTVGALGYAILAGANGTLAPVVVGSTVGALGLAVVITLVTDVAVSAAPPSRAGAASATSETSSELGGALGIAILGSLATAIYRAGLPAGAPAPAHDTLGGALASADRLPAAAGDQLAALARDSFSDALAVTASLGAALLLAAGFVAFRLLRRDVLVEAPVPAAAEATPC